MNALSDDLTLNTALQRGRQSVRDGTVGNPYPHRSAAYGQFERGAALETKARSNQAVDQEPCIRALAF